MAIGLSYATPFRYGLDEVASWSPSNATLVAWWDASDTGTITESSGAVSQIDDKSGNLEHMTQSPGSAQPTTGTRTQNSLNVLDCDGGDYMENTTQAVPASGEITVIGVTVIDSTAATTDSIYSMDASNDWQLQGNNVSQFDGRFGCTGIGTPTDLTGGPFSGALVWELVFDWTGSTITILTNGTSRMSITYSAKLSTSQAWRIMTNRGVTGFLNGAFCEAFIMEEVDSTTRTSAREYLATKWGITL